MPECTRHARHAQVNMHLAILVAARSAVPSAVARFTKPADAEAAKNPTVRTRSFCAYLSGVRSHESRRTHRVADPAATGHCERNRNAHMLAVIPIFTRCWRCLLVRDLASFLLLLARFHLRRQGWLQPSRRLHWPMQWHRLQEAAEEAAEERALGVFCRHLAAPWGV